MAGVLQDIRSCHDCLGLKALSREEVTTCELVTADFDLWYLYDQRSQHEYGRWKDVGSDRGHLDKVKELENLMRQVVGERLVVVLPLVNVNLAC